MKAHELSPNAFKIRMMFLLLIIVMAVIMKIISVIKTGSLDPQSGSNLPVIDKEIILKMPERPVLLDGLAVTFTSSFILDKSEQGRMKRCGFMHQEMNLLVRIFAFCLATNRR